MANDEGPGGISPARPPAPGGGQGATWVIIGALFGGAVLVYLLLFVFGIGR